MVCEGRSCLFKLFFRHNWSRSGWKETGTYNTQYHIADKFQIDLESKS
jgi:hypothetical protein